MTFFFFLVRVDASSALDISKWAKVARTSVGSSVVSFIVNSCGFESLLFLPSCGTCVEYLKRAAPGLRCWEWTNADHHKKKKRNNNNTTTKTKQHFVICSR